MPRGIKLLFDCSIPVPDFHMSLAVICGRMHLGATPSRACRSREWPGFSSTWKSEIDSGWTMGIARAEGFNDVHIRQ